MTQQRERNHPLYGLFVANTATGQIMSNRATPQPAQVAPRQFDATVTNATLGDDGVVVATLAVNVAVELTPEEARQLVDEFGPGLAGWHGRGVAGMVAGGALAKITPSGDRDQYTPLPMPKVAPATDTPQANRRKVIDPDTIASVGYEFLAMPK